MIDGKESVVEAQVVAVEYNQSSSVFYKGSESGEQRISNRVGVHPCGNNKDVNIATGNTSTGIGAGGVSRQLCSNVRYHLVCGDERRALDIKVVEEPDTQDLESHGVLQQDRCWRSRYEGRVTVSPPEGHHHYEPFQEVPIFFFLM